MEEQVQKKAEAILAGDMAGKIKDRIQWASAGLLIGAGIGFVVAALTGKCRLCFAFWGALAGGTAGYITSPKKEKDSNENFCCL